MSRKGYATEIQIKRKLIQEYGELNVIKISSGCGLGFDFMILNDCKVNLGDKIIQGSTKVLKVIEVKECRGKYPHWGKNQKKNIIRFCKFHNVHCLVYVFRPHEPLEMTILKGTEIDFFN